MAVSASPGSSSPIVSPLLRLPARLDPAVVSAAAATHGIMLEKAAWHWANPDTAPPALLIGYGSLRDGDFARGIESVRVLI